MYRLYGLYNYFALALCSLSVSTTETVAITEAGSGDTDVEPDTVPLALPEEVPAVPDVEELDSSDERGPSQLAN